MLHNNSYFAHPELRKPPVLQPGIVIIYERSSTTENMALVTDSATISLWHVNGAACFLVLIVTALLHRFRPSSSKLPMINAEKGSIWSRGYRSRQKYAQDLPNLVQAGLRKVDYSNHTLSLRS